MIKNICNKPIKLLDFNVISNGHYFIAKNDKIELHFIAEYRTGVYSNVLKVIKNGRVYQARRYHYKYVSIAQGLAYQLLINNVLWNYKNNEPAIDDYLKWAKKTFNEADYNDIASRCNI